ncbi:MAG: hypothetical protein NVS1B4_26020 [Gemmatimonadaceae bacterium]
MSATTADRNREHEVPLPKKLDDLYRLIDGIDMAMFTTRRRDGQLVSRPMQTQARIHGTDLWFVTDIHAHKLEELAYDPHVNLGYYNSSSREWVSVSGRATVTQDRAKIKELHKPDWRIWFGAEGGEYDGSANDPRIALILVEAESVVYQVSTKSRPVVLFEMARAMVTGTPPKVADLRELGESELHG